MKRARGDDTKGTRSEDTLGASTTHPNPTHTACLYCDSQFDNYPSYEMHVLSNHHHQCQECRKMFPSEIVLNAHIDENHNPFLRIKQSQGQKIFRCIHPQCDKVCSTPKMRRLHMIDKHGYPRSYDFGIINRGI